MVYTVSLICAVVTFGMALLQLLLTLGAPLGEYALGGQHIVLPKKMRFLSGTFFILWIIVGMAYLQWGNIANVGFGSLLDKIILILNTIFLAYAIIGNGFITKSKKEKYVMTPFSALLFVCSIISFF
ncbi:MAG: hypothetical protein Q8920_13770 [Bacillota bacterium]|nr:hypothetical protein [Bacillota bacterium]